MTIHQHPDGSYHRYPFDPKAKAAPKAAGEPIWRQAEGARKGIEVDERGYMRTTGATEYDKRPSDLPKMPAVQTHIEETSWPIEDVAKSHEVPRHFRWAMGQCDPRWHDPRDQELTPDEQLTAACVRMAGAEPMTPRQSAKKWGAEIARKQAAVAADGQSVIVVSSHRTAADVARVLRNETLREIGRQHRLGMRNV